MSSSDSPDLTQRTHLQIQGLGSRVRGLGFGVSGLGCGVHGLGVGVGIAVQGLGVFFRAFPRFRGLDLQLKVKGFESAFECRYRRIT